ncbi:MAG: ribose 5-phosphate isomerase B [Bacteroidota bacterium]|jgi:ribose 5-phosphate isomerase B|nr:ribose 5-phosphate isomerase B [Bacteroidota bacterium]
MIALAADHGGFNYKERTKALLDSLALPWKDFGTDREESVDYPDFAHPAAEAIQRGECDRGIFFCGTGIGISLAANRHRGIRAAACQVPEAARMSRLHNDANVLALGERLVDWNLAEQMIRVWLETPFEGGRHERRVRKIEWEG